METALVPPADLWQRARSGDAAARGEIALLAREVAAKSLRLRGARASDRDDLAQETVRSTLAYLEGGGEEPRDLRAFLKYRAWGVLSDHRKRERSKGAVRESDANPELVEVEGRATSAALETEMAAALERCREGLAPPLREVLRLRYEERLEGAHAAERLGVQRSTIHVRVFRALASLRECLARHGFGVEDLA